MRVVELKIGKKKTTTSHYYVDENHRLKEADIKALKGIISDFVEFNGDFEAERPDIGPTEFMVSGKTHMRY